MEITNDQVNSMNNYSNEVKNDFNKWFFSGEEIVEKSVAIVILLLEIIILLFHNVPGNNLYYVIAGINCFFSLYAWFSLVNKKWNPTIVMNEYQKFNNWEKFNKFLSGYRYPNESYAESFIKKVVEYRLTKKDIKRDVDKIDKNYLENFLNNEDNIKFFRSNILSFFLNNRNAVKELYDDDIDVNSEVIGAILKITKFVEDDILKKCTTDINLIKFNDNIEYSKQVMNYVRSQIVNDYETDVNMLINQFKIIKYSWLVIGILYLFLIADHFCGNEQYFHYQEVLKPFFKVSEVTISLFSTYFQLAAFYVLYFPTLKNTITGKKEDMHIKKSIWWIGIIGSITTFYIFSMHFYKENSSLPSENRHQIVFYNYQDSVNNNYIIDTTKQSIYDSANTNAGIIIRKNKLNNLLEDKINVCGLNVYSNIYKSVNIPGEVENAKYYIVNNKFNALDIRIDSFCKKTSISVVDSLHNFISFSSNSRILHNLKDSLKTDDIPGISFSENYNPMKGNKTINIDSNINNLDIKIRPKPEVTFYPVSVDFAFQIITGLITAIVLCFLFARFENYSLNTPTWVLIILYIYAVIQAFLVLIDDDWTKQDQSLNSVHLIISQLVLFIALIGKVTLYIYILGIYYTKRLFYYFVIQSSLNLKENLNMGFENIKDNIKF